jgi:membrane-associated phospholipid phosphatase
MKAIQPSCSLDAPASIAQAPGVKPAPASWLQRLRAHLPFKLALLVAVTLIYKIVYVACQQAPWTVPRRWELTWVDRAVTFNPEWTWIYLSIYLLLPAIPFLTVGRDRLTAYLRGAGVMSSVAFAFFYLMPVELPRPYDSSYHPLYAALTAIDRPLNCFPSMHVGFAVFSLLFLQRVRRTEWPELPVVWLWLGWAWAAAIIFSTLATKQHYLVDLLAGASLAWASERLGHRLPLIPVGARWQNQGARRPQSPATPRSAAHICQENQLPSGPQEA